MKFQNFLPDIMEVVIKMASDKEASCKQNAVSEFLMSEEEVCWEYSQTSEE